MQAPLPADEEARLQALKDYQILDTGREAEFDDFTALAAHICGTPIALISLTDADRQWFKSKTGIDADGILRDQAFCAHTIRQPGVFTVPDAQADARFADNPLVTGEMNVRFYAGAPLINGDGHALGALCVIDHSPRVLTADQERALQALSRQVIARLELRRQLAERRQAERELRSSEAIKATILQSALDCIITVDQDGRVLEWNPTSEATFGYRREDAVGRDLAELIVPPALRAVHRRGMAHFMDTSEGPVLNKRIEISAVRSDGTEFPVELAITPISLEGGTLFTATLRDISGRRQAEQALREARDEMEARVGQRTAALAEANRALTAEAAERQRVQEQLAHALQERENIMETVPDILFRLDLGGRLVWWNRKMEVITGLAPEELQDKPSVELFPVAEQESIARAIGEAFQNGYAEVEGHLFSRSGASVLHQFQGVPLRGTGGQIIGLTGTGRDITESRVQQAALAESEQRYRSLVEYSPEGIVVYSDSRLVYLNAAALKLFRAETPDQLLSQPILDRVHPDWRDEARLRAQASQAQGQPSRLAEFKYLRMDGSAVDVEAVSTPILFEGRPAGQVLIRDITGRKRAEQEIYDLHAEVTLAYDQTLNAYDATIEGWSRALDYRDHETEGHSRRLTELTLRLARALGVGERDLVHVRRGALLHDIGKMGVPDRVLLKPGPLDDGEWELMRRHPALAHEMLAPVAFLRPALDIPYCHHEKWDGTGYPRCLRGEQIPLAARLFAVVDVWDALRSDRPYRRAWERERVLDHISSQSGTHFDPQVVAAFLALMAERDQRPALAVAA